MIIQNRYDFVYLFDVENGNPNGDPDAGNAPRIDPETGYGIVTDVCLKRKIRNYVELVREGEEGYNILIKPDKALNTKFSEAYRSVGLPVKKKKDPDVTVLSKARDYMCTNYFDVRTFGAVMSTGDASCGVVRGPVQLTFARSQSPVYCQDITITRQARTTAERQESGETEMGRKSIIPYALYRAEGFVSAALAQKVTGFSDEDLELLWSALINMFENDRSAARGKMCARGLYVFKHESILGNAPSSSLFEQIAIRERQPGKPVRSFGDYEVIVEGETPAGVTLQRKL